MQDPDRRDAFDPESSSEDDVEDTEILDDYDFEEITDTTAEALQDGNDPQGIQWMQTAYTRERYRERRLNTYQNYSNLNPDLTPLQDIAVKPRRGLFFDFHRNSRSVLSSITHFQLRHLLWSTNKHSVYYTNENKIFHWSPVTRRSTLVLNVSGQPLAHVLPRVFKVTVSTLCVKHGLCAVGGFHGEIVIRSLQHPGLLMADRLTRHENCISNGLDLFLSPTGAIRAACANNDGFVRTLDIESGRRLGQFGFEYPVNYTVAQPDGGKLLAVVGDDPVTHVLDANSGAAVFQLSGHLDFSFAAAWHPSGHVLATGNQDTTARIWDLRHAREALHVLKGRMGAVRSLQYSSNGAFLSMAEPADFAHVFDVGHDYRVAQEIDVFGEIAGCTFSPCGEAYYVAIADAQYGSLMQFERALPADVPPPEGYEGPVVGRYKAVTTVPVAEGSGGGSHVRAPGSHVYFAAGGGPAIPAASVAAEVEAVSPFEHLDDVAAAAVAAAADEGEEEGGAGNAAAAAERARRRLLSTHMSMWPRNAGEGPGLGQLGGAFLVNLRGHLGVQSRAQELEGSGPGSGAVSTVALLVAATTGLEDLTE